MCKKVLLAGGAGYIGSQLAPKLLSRDYKVTVNEDAVAGIEKENHDAAIRIMKNVLGVEIVRSRE